MRYRWWRWLIGKRPPLAPPLTGGEVRERERMKKILFLFFILLLILFLYISFGYVFNINRIFIPDFWLVIVFFLALYYNDCEAFGLVFVLGFFRDIFEIGIFGMNSFLFLIIVFFIKYILERVYKESLFNILLILFACSLMYYFLKFVVYNIGGYVVGFGYIYILKSLIVVFVSPFIFKILNKQELNKE